MAKQLRAFGALQRRPFARHLSLRTPVELFLTAVRLSAFRKVWVGVTLFPGEANFLVVTPLTQKAGGAIGSRKQFHFKNLKVSRSEVLVVCSAPPRGQPLELCISYGRPGASIH